MLKFRMPVFGVERHLKIIFNGQTIQETKVTKFQVLFRKHTVPNSFRSKIKKLKCYICVTLDVINIPKGTIMGNGVCAASNDEERIPVPIIYKL